MRIASTFCRVFLGMVFLIFGLNEFIKLIPIGDSHPFVQIMADSGYLRVVNTLQVIGGCLLVADLYVPVALAGLAPVSANILLHALFLDQRYLVPAALVFGVTFFLVWVYREYFMGVFERKAKPASEQSAQSRTKTQRP